MKNAKTLKKEIDEAEAKLSILRVQYHNAMGRKKLTCQNCKKKSQIGSLTYSVSEYYVNEPYAERWEHSDKDHAWKCNKCSVYNRIYWRADIRELRPYFKNCEYVTNWDAYINLKEVLA